MCRLSRFALLVLLMVAAKMHFKEQAGSDQKRQAGRQTCQAREYYRGKYHCTVDLLFDWFGIGCMITGIFLQNRLMQTSQTGGQWYRDASPFSIPCKYKTDCSFINQLCSCIPTLIVNGQVHKTFYGTINVLP